MALNDNATLIVSGGNYLTADTGTALPADLTAPEAAWDNVGHTSLEDILAMETEGGEVTVLGTLQKKSLRTRRSKKQDSFTFILQQFDEPSLKLYYGSNAPTLADGTVGVPDDPIPTEAAFLAVFLDGENVFAFYAPRAEIIGAEGMEIADTENLAGMPISVRPLNYQDNTWPYSVTPIGTVAPAG